RCPCPKTRLCGSTPSTACCCSLVQSALRFFAQSGHGPDGPWPSRVPVPVTATLVCPKAYTNGEKFMHSMPCQRLNTSGYFFVSVLNLTVPSTCRSTLDSRVTAPVRKDFPAGTTTCPPPALPH